MDFKGEGENIRSHLRLPRLDLDVHECPMGEALVILKLSHSQVARPKGGRSLQGHLENIDMESYRPKYRNAMWRRVACGGFNILGPTVCTGTSFAVTSCSPAGNGDGIATSLAANALVNVFNGNVKGMGRFGVNLDGCQQCSVEKVNASHNGSIGILIGRGRLSDNTAFFNGLRGMQNAAGPLLNNYAAGNGQIGIIANCPASVIGNVAEFNGTQGLFINGGGCVASTNASVP